MKKILIMMMLLPFLLTAAEKSSKYELEEPYTEHLLKNGIYVTLKLSGCDLCVRKKDIITIEKIQAKKAENDYKDTSADEYVVYEKDYFGKPVGWHPLGLYENAGVVPVFLHNTRVYFSAPKGQWEKVLYLCREEEDRIKNNPSGAAPRRQTLQPRREYEGQMVAVISVLKKPSLSVLKKHNIKCDILNESVGLMIHGKDLKKILHHNPYDDRPSPEYDISKKAEEFILYGIIDDYDKVPDIAACLVKNDIETFVKPKILYTIYVPYENLAEAKRLLMEEASKGTLFETKEE